MSVSGWPLGIYFRGFFKGNFFSKSFCSLAPLPRMCCSSTILCLYLLRYNQAPACDEKPVALKYLHGPWNTMYLLFHVFRQTFFPFICYFFSCFSVLFALPFLPGASPPFPPYLPFISKSKHLQMTLLLAPSEAKPKCHLGCQVLLHMSMVHPRSECSWVIEHSL